MHKSVNSSRESVMNLKSKDLGNLKYFLGIKVVRSKESIFVS